MDWLDVPRNLHMISWWFSRTSTKQSGFVLFEPVTNLFCFSLIRPPASPCGKVGYHTEYSVLSEPHCSIFRVDKTSRKAARQDVQQYLRRTALGSRYHYTAYGIRNTVTVLRNSDCSLQWSS